MESPRVLTVDDDCAARESLIRTLATRFPADYYSAADAPHALQLLQRYKPQIAIVDLSLNPVEGIESGYSLISAILCSSPACRVIVLTGNAGPEFGVRALSLGSAHFIGKPADVTHLAALVEDSYRQWTLRQSLEQFRLRKAQELDRVIIGRSAAAERLRAEVSYASHTRQSIFIRGETGTGKGLCAQLIHQSGDAGRGHFVRYQPLFNSADLVNSDLFGHRRGAFTGALEDRKGLLNRAHGGTLFLDEIDELPRETQVTLLGVLHDGTFRALGETQDQRSEFRLISASNALIESRIEQGSFRRDLFHRIAHHQIVIPPLRDRREDIADLAHHTVSAMQLKDNTAVYEISNSAIHQLENREWPGNIRELESAVEGGVWRAGYRGSGQVEARDLESLAPAIFPQGKSNFHGRVREYEFQLVQTALKENGGSFSAAGRALGIDRGTVKRIAERASAAD